LWRNHSEFDVGGPVESLALLDVGEDGAELEGVAVVVEAFGALEVEPQDLDGREGTFSTLHFISGTSSFTDFSFRQVRKFSSRKLHSALTQNGSTLLAWGARTAGPYLIIL
jgi:hypothetical protein